MMLKKEIMDSYEKVKLDEETRKRMLKNIQSLAANEQLIGKENNKMKFKKIVGCAAAFAIALSIPAISYTTKSYATGAYATNPFHLNLDGINLGKTTINFDSQEYTKDMLYLQGMTNSPEYKANKEWQAFLEEYDKDGTILSKVGNSTVGLGDYEEVYNCYTQEMADKVDEICKKYHLSKLSKFELLENFKQIGMENLIKTKSKDMKNTPLCGYCYSNGTFQMDGIFELKGPKKREYYYQIRRSIKGSFDPVIVCVDNINDFKEWQYVTEGGETVLLANSSEGAVIRVETENSIISVTIDNISDKELEACANTFDFSVIP